MPTCNDSHSLELFAAGSNSHGQLGLGHTDDVHRFTLAQRWPASAQVLSFAAGARHSLFLIEAVSDSSVGKRTLLASGDRSNHQLPSCGLPEQTSTQFTEINYEALISSIQSIDHAFRKKLLTAYQPAKVASSWETSFVVLEPLEERSLRTDSSVVVAFGSDDFGLRGTRSGILNTSEPNLVDLKTHVQSIISISDLVAGPKHVVAVVSIRDPESNNISVSVI